MPQAKDGGRDTTNINQKANSKFFFVVSLSSEIYASPIGLSDGRRDPSLRRVLPQCRAGACSHRGGISSNLFLPQSANADSSLSEGAWV